MCEYCEQNYDKYNDYERDYDIYDDDYNLIDGVGFAQEGSALQAETKDNPRIHSCPTCGSREVLTCIDVARHYQCDGCEIALKRGRNEDRWFWDDEYTPEERAAPPTCPKCSLTCWEAKYYV